MNDPEIKVKQLRTAFDFACYGLLVAMAVAVLLCLGLLIRKVAAKSRSEQQLVQPVAPFEDKSRELTQQAFEAGAKLGYACAIAGGSKSDLEIIVNAQRSNRVDIVHDWFKGKQ